MATAWRGPTHQAYESRATALNLHATITYPHLAYARRLSVLPGHIPHTLYVITNAPEHAGKPWNVRDNVHAIAIDQARKSEFDCILFQNAGLGRGAQYVPVNASVSGALSPTGTLRCSRTPTFVRQPKLRCRLSAVARCHC